MFYTKTVTTMKNNTENQEKIDEESISNEESIDNMLNKQEVIMEPKKLLWDTLLNKILDNYTEFEFDIIRTEHIDFYTVNFVYNKKIYMVVKDLYGTSRFYKEEIIYSLYGIKEDDENVTYVQNKNILPLKPETKERFAKVLSELQIRHDNREQAKIDEENLKIYQ